MTIKTQGIEFVSLHGILWQWVREDWKYMAVVYPNDDACRPLSIGSCAEGCWRWRVVDVEFDAVRRVSEVYGSAEEAARYAGAYLKLQGLL